MTGLWAPAGAKRPTWTAALKTEGEPPKDKLHLFTLTSRCAEKGAKGRRFQQPILALRPSA